MKCLQMKVLFLARATLYKVYGGGTVQVESTAKYLRRMGVAVDIRLSGERIDYSPYDLIHYFNITRPAAAPVKPGLREKIAREYTWNKTARPTLAAYESVLTRMGAAVADGRYAMADAGAA